MNKASIVTEMQNLVHYFTETCLSIEDDIFFTKTKGKWSVAENIQHLILSANTTLLAFQLPKTLIRWIGGIPTHASRSYEEVHTLYNKKLDEGAKASARYIPKPLHIKKDKSYILNKWNTVNSRFIFVLNKKNTEQELDRYLITHPLLGPITLREICYFTLFHTSHHLNSIIKLSAVQTA